MNLSPLEWRYLDTIQTWRNAPSTRAHVRETRYLSSSDQHDWFDRQRADDTVRYMMATEPWEREFISPPKLLGLVGLTSIDWINRRAEVSVLSPEHERECLELLVGYAFDTLGLHRLEGETITKNRDVLLQDHGFEMESFRVHAYWRNGDWVDSTRWALLNSDADTPPETLDAMTRRYRRAPL